MIKLYLSNAEKSLTFKILIGILLVLGILYIVNMYQVEDVIEPKSKHEVNLVKMGD